MLLRGTLNVKQTANEYPGTPELRKGVYNDTQHNIESNGSNNDEKG